MPGKLILTADWRGSHLRLLAHYSEDEVLTADLQGDVYQAPAALLVGLGVPAENARKAAKRALLTKLNGGGKELLGKSLVELGAPQIHGERARLELHLTDRRALLAYQVYVDGVPIAPEPTPVAGQEARVTAEVSLLPGPNTIEVSALNRRGIESPRALVNVDRPGAPRGDLIFVGFGVSHYADDRLDLAYAAKDVADLAAVMGALNGYDAVRIHTFTDAQVTRAAVDEAVAIAEASRLQDTLVLFVAGHGLHDDDAQGTYYYLTHDARVDDLSSTASSFEQFERLLLRAPARRKLFLLDTCESGEREPGEDAAVFAAAGARGLSPRAARGFDVVQKKRAPVRPRHDRTERFLYRDLARRSGAVVLSSSRGSELSYESADVENGLFTEELLRALGSVAADRDADGIVGVDELREHVASRVAAATRGAQNPTIDRDNMHLHARMGLSLPEDALRADARKGWLGLQVSDERQEVMEREHGLRQPALFVHGVVPGSPAERADLRAMDLVLAVDGVAVRDIRSFIADMQRRRPGVVTVLHVLRNGEPIEIAVRLGAVPEGP